MEDAARSKHWIQTFTGKKFFPLDPDPALLDIRDIARALSMTCRYVGHVIRFYSVAEHCVRVSREVERRLVLEHNLDADSAVVRYQAQWGLIHDASEAYLGDVSRPVKHQPAMAEYRAFEKHLQGMIAQWLGLRAHEPTLVAQVDCDILGTEARQLKAPVHPDWHKTTATGELQPEFPGVTLGWSPDTAEKVYLDRFRKLFVGLQTC